MAFKLIAEFGCEGSLWRIYHQDSGEKIGYLSTTVLWPGGDEWVEEVDLKGPHLEDVLPELWVRYSVRKVATESVVVFQEAYRRMLECLTVEQRQRFRYDCKRWEELLALPHHEENSESLDFHKPE